jgi:hypothetical protein
LLATDSAPFAVHYQTRTENKNEKIIINNVGICVAFAARRM